MQRFLFVVHLEPMFDDIVDYENLIYMLADVVEQNQYDRVIALFSYLESGREPDWYDNLCAPKVAWEWSWGYEKTGDEKYDRWIIPSDYSAHEWTYVPEEVREMASLLSSSEVDICGIFDGECLTDWEAVLEHLNIPYNRLSEVIA